jgi:DNA-directed RNA polymerase specialized sigma24 family protein
VSLESISGHDGEAGEMVPAALVDPLDPCLHAQRRQQLARVQARLEVLPPPLRRTFELHVVLGHSTQEVCEALAISRANLWVRVHRVRQELAAAA